MKFSVPIFAIFWFLEFIIDCYGAIPCTNHDDCGGIQCPAGYAPYCATILFSQCKCSQSDAIWSTWTAWSQCSVTCGAASGSRTRQRNCAKSGTTNDFCVGNHLQGEVCRANSSHCPRDGHWGHWLAWSPCSVSCGKGTRQRLRQCNNPPPAYGGSYCSGYVRDNQACSHSCTSKPCPSCDENLNCVWNQTCSASESCMVRAVTGHGFQFTVHCILSQDCHFMTTFLHNSEIYCCDDRDCLRKYIGI
ncbi:thrombospondin-1-like [Saccostrea cucullata]|uniref:thrombospondin-1-like n=1 Tax=Saccostrea cuccullata TaxID=36930 RepID=UPI002ED5691A